MNSIFKIILYVYKGLIIGFIIGFNVAWLTMKITWVDMRFPTEVFIPAGLILGLLAGIVATFYKFPGVIVKSHLVILFISSMMTIVTFMVNMKAAYFVAPIIVRSGLKLKSLEPGNFWASFIVSLFVLIVCLNFVNQSKSHEKHPGRLNVTKRRLTQDEA